ncbi:MAG TPA: DUF192 domain-containing protein [Acetobacteraceae bacterium]|nr:DUF192 domain-containing protein [Acetobacteraceae bacterium]
MNRRILLALLIAAPIAAFAPSGFAQSGFTQSDPKGPQPELAREHLTIITQDGKRHAFDVEMARTQQQQITGLMYRTKVAPDGGMLFVWPTPIVSQMWMKHTLVPLDMVFIRADGTIDSIAEDTVPQSLRVISSHGKVTATLELAGGTTRRLGITVGDKVEGPMFHPAG